MKVGIVLGTRPEIIKMDSVIKECKNRGIRFFIVHTNQHYTREMDAVIFENLGLPKPKYNLGVGSGIHGLQTGKMLSGIEEALLKEKPTYVLVHGDTNTTLAGALAARKLNITVGHVEAGLRSFDHAMPEEVNRVLSDHMADFLFAPTEISKENLLKEGIAPKKIFVTGNTVVDAIKNHSNAIVNNEKAFLQHGVASREYALATLHRPSNVDDKRAFLNIVTAFGNIHKQTKLPILYPIHPRSKKMMEMFRISLPEGVRLIDPLGFFDFMTLQKHARLILTDSGGIQEEACVLGVPCVTLRFNTERPESIAVRANVLVGNESQKIVKGAVKMLKRKPTWEHPFGDGRAGKRIINILVRGYVKKRK
jgi:UDP-N-acetylglucosamine 2-epimerase (non-hydrolysing)